MMEINREEYGREVEKDLFKLGLIKDEQKFFKEDTDVIQEEEKKKYLKGSSEDIFKQIRHIGNNLMDEYENRFIWYFINKTRIPLTSRIYAVLTGKGRPGGMGRWRYSYDYSFEYPPLKIGIEFKDLIKEIHNTLKNDNFKKLVLLEKYNPQSKKCEYNILKQKAIEYGSNIEIVGRQELELHLDKKILNIIKKNRPNLKGHEIISKISHLYTKGAIGLYPVSYISYENLQRTAYFPINDYNPLNI